MAPDDPLPPDDAEAAGRGPTPGTQLQARPQPPSCPYRRDADGYYLDPEIPNRKVCGSPLRGRPGRWCRRIPARGMLRCRLHGGASPRGAAHPSFQSGFYSKHLPSAVRRTFLQARDDPELLNLQDDVALYNAHLKELWERLGSGESSAAWEELLRLAGRLGEASAQLDQAVRTGNADLFRQAADAIAAAVRAQRELINRAEGRRETWEEIHEVQRQKAATAVADWKRQVDLKTLIPAADAMSLIQAIMFSVKRHVSDIRAQAAVAAEISNFINAVRKQKRPAEAEEAVP